MLFSCIFATVMHRSFLKQEESMAENKECFEGRVWRHSSPEERFEAVLSSISDGVYAVDNRMNIACFNRAAEAITGYKKEEVLGRPCHDVLQTNICHDACAMRYTLETGQPIVDLAITITSANGETLPVSISTSLLRDKEGRVVGGVETFRDLRLVESLRRQVEKSYSFADIIGKSALMQSLFERLPTVAIGDSTVLIRGESGTGKELVAHALHDLSDRKEQPFVAVNCGALPSELIESELFGYKAGAFTGATRDKPGRVALAKGGTLFLDEIGDLPLPMQVKLLRFLQEKTYEPLGGHASETSDVRILSATNRDLVDNVRERSFREDLYYRLNVIELKLPPLRRREGDVPLLAEHFLRRLRLLRNKQVSGFSPDAMRALLGYNYPGNVRELENIVEHAFVLCPGGLIAMEHLPDVLRSDRIDPDSCSPATLEEMEREFLTRKLAENGYNRLETAKALGIHKTTLHRKIRKLGLDLPDRDGRSRNST